MSDETQPANKSVGGELAGLQEQISERLAFGQQPLKVLDEQDLSPEDMEAVKLVNAIYYRLGCLLDDLAFQSLERYEKGERDYGMALEEVGLISEFVVQLAERNKEMRVLSDRSSEELYRDRGDDVRFWVGDFEYLGERVDFHVMVRPAPFRVPDLERPGVYSESRDARLGVTLSSKRYHIDLRLDPASRSVCFDLDAPVLKMLDFSGVGQSGAHHFYTEKKLEVPSEEAFRGALKGFIRAFDSRVSPNVRRGESSEVGQKTG